MKDDIKNDFSNDRELCKSDIHVAHHYLTRG